MNRLGTETSPYLAQHADNPVDWYPWGEEAFAAAAALDRPLFISIGYSSCHWCHVMAHESFEDEATGAVLNASFVAVKVDREERPDVDAIYMETVQALTGRGGWPLSVFATPDGRPFYGGTYYPPRDAAGLPGFVSVLEAVSAAWRDRRDEIVRQADKLTEAVAGRLAPPAGLVEEPPPAGRLLDEAVGRFSELFDEEEGGVAGAPKFPQPSMLELVLRAGAAGGTRAGGMVALTLEAMASGGIYDHLGGGFHRYSVDRHWLVPHFEKMLYDQALLARLYLHAHQVTGERRWRQVVEETLGYVLRDLALAGGGLAGSEDADSAGVEGLFYTWTPEEVTAVLGEAAPAAMAFYGMSGRANYEHGRSILFRPERGALERPAPIESARAALFAARAERVRPGRDDKVVTEWNAMAVAVLCEAAAVTGSDAYARAATALAAYLESELVAPDGRLLRSAKDGRPGGPAVATDYGWMIEALVRLGELTGTARHLSSARRLAGDLLGRFAAPDGGFYLTASDAKALVVRPRDGYDGVVPSANSVCAGALFRLGAALGDPDLVEAARRVVAAGGAGLVAGPLAFTHLLSTALALEAGPVEVAVGARRPDLLAALRRAYLPDVVIATSEVAELLEVPRDEDLAYVCRAFACLPPVGDVDGVLSALAGTTG